jgi:hypothetical protein
MSRFFTSGRGPALIASSLVLAAAIGGTAIAATSGGGAPEQPKAKASKSSLTKQIDKRIKKLAPRLHVAFAKNSDNSGRSNGSTGMDGYKKTGMVPGSVGQRVELTTVGPFTFSLQCRAGVNNASPAEGSVVGEIDVASTETGNAIESASTTQAAQWPAAAQYPLTDRSTSTNPKTAPDEPNFDGADGYFTAMSPSGTVVSGVAYVGTHIMGHDCVGGVTLLK